MTGHSDVSCNFNAKFKKYPALDHADIQFQNRCNQASKHFEIYRNEEVEDTEVDSHCSQTNYENVYKEQWPCLVLLLPDEKLPHIC